MARPQASVALTNVLLVDTSVWIEVFRAESPVRLSDYAAIDEIATCLPVIQEVVQGFRDERAYRTARESMLSLAVVESPLTQELFIEAAELFRAARRSGRTIRSGVDCLIAACALRHDLIILHHDRDFESLAAVSAVRTQTI